MKLTLTFKFTDTEEEARAFVDCENRAHPRRKSRAHYTPWQSSDPSDTARYIVWYYEQTGAQAMRAGDRYDIRQVDALMYEDEWVYNQTIHIGTFTTAAKDTARAFRRALRKMGISFIHPHQTTTVYDGDVYEVIDRKTGEPLFCAIPRED